MYRSDRRGPSLVPVRPEGSSLGPTGGFITGTGATGGFVTGTGTTGGFVTGTGPDRRVRHWDGPMRTTAWTTAGSDVRGNSCLRPVTSVLPVGSGALESAAVLGVSSSQEFLGEPFSDSFFGFCFGVKRRFDFSCTLGLRRLLVSY